MFGDNQTGTRRGKENTHDSDSVLVLVTVLIPEEFFGCACDPVYSSSYQVQNSEIMYGSVQDAIDLPIKDVTTIFVASERLNNAVPHSAMPLQCWY